MDDQSNSYISLPSQVTRHAGLVLDHAHQVITTTLISRYSTVTAMKDSYGWAV